MTEIQRLLRTDWDPPHHRQVEIEVGGERTEVDAGIAPLVLALNKLPEIYTLASCECDEVMGIAWVAFNRKRCCTRSDVRDLTKRLQKQLVKCHLQGSFEETTIYVKSQGSAHVFAFSCAPLLIKEIAACIGKFAQEPRKRK